MSSHDAERPSTDIGDASAITADFRALFDASPTPLLVVAPPDWIIVAANDARLQVTGTTREEQIGRRLFDVFPDDPEDPTADGVRNLTASLERVVATGATDTMAVQRYSVREASGRFVERWWAPVNTPVIGDKDEVVLIIHHVEDVTELVRLRGEADGRDHLARTQQLVIDRLRESEAAQRDAEERYLALFNAIDQGFCTIEVAFDEQDRPTDYRFLEISASFERQTGIENGAGRWMREIAPDQDQFWFDTLGRVALSGEPARFESYSTPLARWWDVYAFRISGPRRIALLFRDVTDQKRAQEELRASEARFRDFGEAAADALWIADAATGQLEYLSPAFQRIWGEPREAVMADIRRWADFLHPDDRAAAQSGMSRLLAGERFTNEYRIVRADGEVRWILDVGFPILDDSGRVVRAGGIAQDLTERRLAEEALRRGELALRQLNDTLERQVHERTAERNRVWEMSRDLFAIMGFDGHLKVINPAWEVALGRDTETLLSLSFREQVHPDDHPAVEAVMEQLLRGQSVQRFEDRLRHADHSWRWISWTLVPEGDVFYAVGRDVTDEKSAAAELEQAQEALRQSQKMEAMGQLTGGVAHDFNNLLTPIVGSLDMLQRKGVGGEREQRLIAGALQSADRAKTLVQRLLAFARRQPLQASAVDVGGLVAGMADLVASTSGPQIKVVVEAAKSMPPAQADANQLEMALLNLGVNARDAMPEGGTLRITARAQSVAPGHRSKLRPGEYIRLSVADTGIGMDEATLKRAVEPFFSTKGVGKGTGLGLSMVHGLASQLGGALTIDSRPGLGTNIELWLPVSETRAELPKVAVAAEPLPSARGKVLLVDDEELVRMSTADMLDEMGYAVTEASSAEEALSLLQGGLRPDLLVTDHLMPGMNGTELAHIARSEHPEMQVLVVSGYAESDGIDAGLPRLTKPFRNADLASKLAELGSGS